MRCIFDPIKHLLRQPQPSYTCARQPGYGAPDDSTGTTLQQLHQHKGKSRVGFCTLAQDPPRWLSEQRKLWNCNLLQHSIWSALPQHYTNCKGRLLRASSRCTAELPLTSGGAHWDNNELAIRRPSRSHRGSTAPQPRAVGRSSRWLQGHEQSSGIHTSNKKRPARHQQPIARRHARRCLAHRPAKRNKVQDSG